MTESEPRHTPLFEVYERYGARLTEFGEWMLPVRFSTIREEHLAVRRQAGLFDVSHMGEIRLKGAAAFRLLQRVATNDAGKLADGRAQYSALLNDSGGFIDDIFVYRIRDDEYFLCVNATNATRDFEWIRDHAEGKVEVLNESELWAQLALQGPAAEAILKLVAEEDPKNLPRFTIKPARLMGLETLVARTGYTGEDGFEIFIAPAHAAGLWEGLMNKGQNLGLLPCGLGARDTLRLEMGYPLHGHDITPEITPLEADLEWIVGWNKPDFIGKGVLAMQKDEGLRRKRVGLMMEDKAPAREHYPIRCEGEPAGEVTSGTSTPSLEMPIAMGYVHPEYAHIGNTAEIEIRDKWHPAKMVKMPFYKKIK